MARVRWLLVVTGLLAVGISGWYYRHKPASAAGHAVFAGSGSVTDHSSFPKLVDDDLRKLGAASRPVRPESAAATTVPALDRSRPWLEQISELESSAQNGDAIAAAQMHLGWQACRSHEPRDVQARADLARMRVAFQHDIAEQVIAQVPDVTVQDQAVEAVAQVDLEAARADETAALAELERFCAGTEAVPWEERKQRTRHWLERAALLGDPGSRRAFVFEAFNNYRDSYAEAAQIARIKPIVLAVVAEGLAAGDPYMLGEMAVLVGQGYYVRPDPERGYAYALAYLRAPSLAEDPSLPGWFSTGPMALRSYVFIRQLSQSLASALTPQARARAERLAGQLLSACCDAGAWP